MFRGEELTVKTSLKYLGLIIDSKLLWKEHINYIRTKSTQILMRLLIYSKNYYGLNSTALSTIYKGAIIPIIAYGCSLWSDVLEKQYIKEILWKIQRSAAIRICKAYRTVSNIACDIITNLMPLDLVLKQKAIEYFAKNNINNNLTQNYLINQNIDLESIQRPIDVYTLRPIGERDRIKTRNNITDDYIITTALRQDNGTGAALIAQIDNNEIVRKVKLHQICSKFQGYLYAIRISIQLINNKFKDQRLITIVVNKTCIQALMDFNSTNVLVNNIYNEWHKAKEKGIDIQFCSEMNDNIRQKLIECISNAEQAIYSHNLIAFDLIPDNVMKKKIREQMIDEWEQRYQTSMNGTQTKKYFPTVKDRIELKNRFIFDFKTTQMITRHGNINYDLKRFKIKDNECCDRCIDSIDDSDHRIFYCHKYMNERAEFREKIEELGYMWPTSHQNQTVFVKHKVINYFTNFCQKVIDKICFTFILIDR
jgi:hypothetical protein